MDVHWTCIGRALDVHWRRVQLVCQIHRHALRRPDGCECRDVAEECASSSTKPRSTYTQRTLNVHSTYTHRTFNGDRVRAPRPEVNRGESSLATPPQAPALWRCDLQRGAARASLCCRLPGAAPQRGTNKKEVRPLCRDGHQKLHPERARSIGRWNKRFPP